MAGSKKRKKDYPRKRSMNLYYKPDRTTKPATISLYVLFVFCVFLLFGKLFVYDILMDVGEQKQEIAELEEQMVSIAEQAAGYNEITDKYNRYSITEEEKNLTDRLEILNLIDEAVRSDAEVTAINISEGTVALDIAQVASLKKTEAICQRLEESSLVEYVSVPSATKVKINDQDMVQTHIDIKLRLEGQKEAEEQQYEETTVEP